MGMLPVALGHIRGGVEHHQKTQQDNRECNENANLIDQNPKNLCLTNLE